MPKLSIIILSWNQKQVLSNCLKSLATTLSAIDSEVILVDNGSTDGTIEFVRSEHPYVRLIQNTQNRGVAAARNQGITQAQGQYILILDNDTVVNTEAISGMLSYMESHPEAGVVSCRLLNFDGSIQESCKDYPGIIIKACNVLGLRQPIAAFPVDHEDVIHPTYMIGACQLFPQKIIDTVGLLDEKIFYGPEDADFCIRVSQAGYQICHLPQFSIKHLHRRQTTRSILSPLGRKHLKALLHFYRKHKRWL